jgi:hypothetical protein
MSLLCMESVPNSMVRSGSNFGNGLVFASKTALCWPVNSMKRETPMAVMSTVSFGRWRSGR